MVVMVMDISSSLKDVANGKWDHVRIIRERVNVGDDGSISCG